MFESEVTVQCEGDDFGARQPTEGAFYAKDGFESGETCWSCICSTEEMIYNKMYRRNRELFNADKNCELTKPYETLAKVGETGESAKAPRRAGR